MTHCNKKYGLGLVLAIVTSLVPMVSSAAIITIPAVTINETFNPELGKGRYSVNNNSAEAVYAFVVGNNTAAFADGGEFQDVVSPDIWSWSIIDRVAWEGGASFFGYGAVNSWTVPDTSTLNWDSIFGVDILQVVSYWVVDDTMAIFSISGTSTPILPGELRSQFTFEANLPASPFIAFSQNGGTVGQGETITVVPVPAAAWLFVSGLLGFVGVAAKGMRHSG